MLVPAPGTWRLFLQTKVDGRVVTAPFTLKVSYERSTNDEGSVCP